MDRSRLTPSSTDGTSEGRMLNCAGQAARIRWACETSRQFSKQPATCGDGSPIRPEVAQRIPVPFIRTMGKPWGTSKGRCVD